MNSVSGVVELYLQMHGHAQSPAFFQDTGYRIGQEFSTPLYSMTWRQENNVLLVCDIRAVRNVQGLTSAMSALILLWKNIINDIPEITEIRGMIAQYGSAREQLMRQKMVELLQKEGAEKRIIDGDIWLIYRG